MLTAEPHRLRCLRDRQIGLTVQRNKAGQKKRTTDVRTIYNIEENRSINDAQIADSCKQSTPLLAGCAKYYVVLYVVGLLLTGIYIQLSG